MRFRSTLRGLCLATLVALLWLSSVTHAGEFKRIRLITDVANGAWEEGVFLYVKGNIPQHSDAKLRRIADVAERERTTVILGEHSRGESFNVPHVQRFETWKAVDMAVGVGLLNRADFSAHIDEESELPDYSAMLITFDAKSSGLKRQVIYYTSPHAEHFDVIAKRDFPESRMIQVAGRPLQNGLKVQVAIENTFEFFRDRLKPAVEQARQGLRTASANIDNASKNVTLVRSKLGAFKKAHPNLTGDLVRPNLERLNTALVNARAALKNVTLGNVNKSSGAGSLNTAETLTASANAKAEEILASLDTYPKALERLKGLESRLTTLKADSKASAAEGLFETAEREKTDFLARHERGDSSYFTHLTALTEAVEGAESAISSAHFRARAAFLTFATVFLVAFAIAAITLWRLRTRSQAAQAKVQKLHKKWKAARGAKLSALFLLRQRRSILGDQESAGGLVGESKKLAQQVIDGTGKLFLIHSAIGKALAKAEAAMTPANPLEKLTFAFSTAPFEKAEKLLGDTPIEFDPYDGLEGLFAADDADFAELDDEEAAGGSDLQAFLQQLKTTNSKDAELEILWAKIDDFEPFSKSFDELEDEFSTLSVETSKNVLRLETAITGIAKAIKLVAGKIDGLNARYDKIEAIEGDAVVAFESFDETLIPNLETQVSEIKSQSLLDPVTAIDSTEELRARIEAVDTLLVSILESINEDLPKIESAHDILVENEIGVDWILSSLSGVAKRANQTLASFTGVGTKGITSSFGADLSNLADRANRAIKLESEIQGKAAPAIQTVEQDISRVRKQVGTALERPAAEILVERGKNPDDLLSEAKQFCKTATLSLGAGELEVAKKLVSQANSTVGQARTLVSQTEEVFARFVERHTAISKQGADFESDSKKLELTLDYVRENFDDAVLMHTAGDESSPITDGTIDNNIEEIAEAKGDRIEALGAAKQLFDDGRLLAAWEKINQSEALNKLIELLSAEIVDKQERLDRAVDENGERIESLRVTLKQLEEKSRDSKTRTSTQTKLTSVQELFTDAIESHAAPLPNPFETEAQLSKVMDGAMRITQLIGNDWTEHADLLRSISAAESSLDRLQQLSRSVKGKQDDIADSPALKRMFDAHLELQQQLTSVVAATKPDHSDWFVLDDQVDDINLQAKQLLSEMQGEVGRGKNAVEQIQSARRKVNEAKNWTGSYGVYVSGSPGSRALASARQALESGNYEEAVNLANRARGAADSAIDTAEAEVSRKRREEEERKRRERARRRREREAAEAAARAARRRRQSSYSSSSSFSSSSSSSSSFGGFSSGGGGGGFGGGGFSSGGGGGGW